MATKTTTKAKQSDISIVKINRDSIDFAILGRSPLILNAMSAKVRQELLFPAAKKNMAERASRLKHEPMQEFKSSMYSARSPKSPTEIVIKATAFKKAMMGAALDLPGTAKTQIGRLTFVEGDEIPIYGIPQIMSSVTRSADIKKTPDVRTRAIIPHWACYITVTYMTPILKNQAIINLIGAAGMLQGVGDWRVEKGSGNYGQFDVVPGINKAFNEIIKTGGKAAQLKAIENPVAYDSETEELLSWFDVEVKRRGFSVVGG